MRILVTAFGPFDGRAENASLLALRGLKKAFPMLRTRVLPVDMVVAPARLKQALRRIRPDALIMLGEAAGSKTIRLETTAWNEIDFRIPDIAGRQAASRPIRRGAAAKLSSTLPLAEIHDLFLSGGHPATLSHDPGRYLCNQIFYLALRHLEGTPCPAGFIHLPLASEYLTENAVDALGGVIQFLLNCSDLPAGPQA